MRYLFIVLALIPFYSYASNYEVRKEASSYPTKEFPKSFSINKNIDFNVVVSLPVNNGETTKDTMKELRKGTVQATVLKIQQFISYFPSLNIVASGKNIRCKKNELDISEHNGVFSPEGISYIRKMCKYGLQDFKYEIKGKELVQEYLDGDLGKEILSQNGDNTKFNLNHDNSIGWLFAKYGTDAQSFYSLGTSDVKAFLGDEKKFSSDTMPTVKHIFWSSRRKSDSKTYSVGLEYNTLGYLQNNKKSRTPLIHNRDMIKYFNQNIPLLTRKKYNELVKLFRKNISNFYVPKSYIKNSLDVYWPVAFFTKEKFKHYKKNNLEKVASRLGVSDFNDDRVSLWRFFLLAYTEITPVRVDKNMLGVEVKINLKKLKKELKIVNRKKVLDMSDNS